MPIQNLFAHPESFLLFAISLVVAVTVHEFAHAWTADRLGDPTPRSQGRVTLNPLAHLDPVGTLALLLVGFGWGKPVEFDPYNLKNHVRDAALIAFAGPLSNIVMAIGASLFLNFFPTNNELLISGAVQFIYLNLVLAIFNLVPVAPLDGEKIIHALLPRKTAYEYRQFMNQWGLYVLILLIFPIFGGQSPVSQLISPIIGFLANLLI